MTPAERQAQEDFRRFQQKARAFLGIFFALFTINIAYTNYVARNMFAETQQVAARTGTLQPGEADRLVEVTGRAGFQLVLLNPGAFVHLGVAARANPPVLGPGYYASLVFGAACTPLFLTIIVWFLFNPPSKGEIMPGVHGPKGNG